MAFADFWQEILGSEVIIVAEDERYQRLALFRETEPLGGEERLGLPKNGLKGLWIHGLKPEVACGSGSREEGVGDHNQGVYR